MPTLKQVIDAVDAIQPNPYTSAQKMAWLNEVMAMVQTDVWLVNAYNVYQFTDYDTDKNKALPPVPPGYSMLWESWLKAKIHSANEENDLYANAAAMFNEEYGGYIRWFARTYEPSDMIRNRTRKVIVAANNEGYILLTLPERALAVDVRLNVTLAASNNSFQIWAAPRQNTVVQYRTAVGPSVNASLCGDNALGWIDCSAINGDLPADVGVSSTGAEAQAVLTMKVFVPEDVYIMMQHNRHRDRDSFFWDPWND